MLLLMIELQADAILGWIGALLTHKSSSPEQPQG